MTKHVHIDLTGMRVMDIIFSCETYEQLLVAAEYGRLWVKRGREADWLTQYFVQAGLLRLREIQNGFGEGIGK